MTRFMYRKVCSVPLSGVKARDSSVIAVDSEIGRRAYVKAPEEKRKKSVVITAANVEYIWPEKEHVFLFRCLTL